MKNIFLLIVLFFPFLLLAQEEEPFRIVDEKPVLRSCLTYATNMEREQCSNQGILTFIYQNVAYPEAALEQELEGMVVVEVIIGKTGRVIGGKLIKDIGGGCGPAVVEALRGLESIDGLWIPAAMKNIPVDYAMTIPVKFTIPEPPPPPLPYQVFGKDTIYHEYSTSPVYSETAGDLDQLLKEKLKFPESYKDSCLAGTMEAQMIIGKLGQVKIVEIVDFENLGFDFQFQLIQLLNNTVGNWQPGTYGDKKVNVIHNVLAVFSPKGNGCEEVAQTFAAANGKAELGNSKYKEGDLETALQLWGEAIEMIPENGAFRLSRGQALLENNLDPAQCCEDLTIAQQKFKLPPLLKGTLPLLCRQAELEEQKLADPDPAEPKEEEKN